MRQLLLAEVLVEGTELIGFAFLEGTTPGISGQAHDRVDVPGFSGEEFLLEFRSASLDRLTQWLEGVGVSVLRRELVEGFERLYLQERLLTDETQVRPKTVELGGGLIIEHQSSEGFVLAVEQRERHDFIDRHDTGVAKRGREDIAEFLGRTQELPLGGTTLGRKQGSAETHRAFAIAPFSTLLLIDRGAGREDAAGDRRRRSRHPRLDAGRGRSLLWQMTFDQEFGPLGQAGR